MKKMNILLLGAHINSTNLGCQALTYSLVNLLKNISDKYDISMKYYVFEYNPSKSATKTFINRIGLSEDQLCSYKFPFAVTLKNKIRNFSSIHIFNNVLKKMDIAIDITAGDSFSDIYGDNRFLATTIIKDIVEKKKIPLILAPQTYGPFNNKRNESFAAEIIKKAYRVITRDLTSAEYVKIIAGREIPVTTDIAFQLPYKKSKRENNKISVGINISGLLVKNTIEGGFVNKNNLKVDYDKYINSLLEVLIRDNKYDIFLIPHVEEDFKACKDFNLLYPETKLVKPFDNPMDVKSFISGMDIFIGARMHATIGAFTSGVVTIPTAYSRKFETMFSVVEYNTIVDLQKLNTKEALERTMLYIQNYSDIQKQLKKSLEIVEHYKKKTEAFFSEAVLSLEDSHE